MQTLRRGVGGCVAHVGCKRGWQCRGSCRVQQSLASVPAGMPRANHTPRCGLLPSKLCSQQYALTCVWQLLRVHRKLLEELHGVQLMGLCSTKLAPGQFGRLSRSSCCTPNSPRHPGCGRARKREGANTTAAGLLPAGLGMGQHAVLCDMACCGNWCCTATNTRSNPLWLALS